MVKYYKEVTTVQKELTSIQCDKCLKVYVDAEQEDNCITSMNDMFELGEFHSISITGGYGSVFGDGNIVQADICQHCLQNLIGQFCRITER